MMYKLVSKGPATLMMSFLVSGFVISAHAEAAVKETRQVAQQDVATNLCQAAIVSPEALQREAKMRGISKRKLKQLECNDLPVLILAKQQQESSIFDARNLVNIE
jgi:Asp/Glu/hydantoin racemase